MRLARYFQTKFLDPADQFITSLNPKARKKLVDNIDYAEQTKDPILFKKLHDEIWEFRTRYKNQQIRLLAFWDKTDSLNTLVVATHGFIKKVDKVPGSEIERAKNIRKKYFETQKQ